jgi:hypothetical protein
MESTIHTKSTIFSYLPISYYVFLSSSGGSGCGDIAGVFSCGLLCLTEEIIQGQSQRSVTQQGLLKANKSKAFIQRKLGARSSIRHYTFMEV